MGLYVEAGVVMPLQSTSLVAIGILAHQSHGGRNLRSLAAVITNPESRQFGRSGHTFSRGHSGEFPFREWRNQRYLGDWFCLTNRAERRLAEAGGQGKG
jgi:hypothetical protein